MPTATSWSCRTFWGTCGPGIRDRIPDIDFANGGRLTDDMELAAQARARHPNLRGGVIELGAGWVPQMLRRLDQVVEIWKRSEPDLAALGEAPSAQITRQMAFTPYPFEDVGAMIRDSNENLYLFSSDYPHIEGGRNPLGRFNASLEGFDDSVLDRFFADNMADLLEARS